MNGILRPDLGSVWKVPVDVKRGHSPVAVGDSGVAGVLGVAFASDKSSMTFPSDSSPEVDSITSRRLSFALAMACLARSATSFPRLTEYGPYRRDMILLLAAETLTSGAVGTAVSDTINQLDLVRLATGLTAFCHIACKQV